MTWPLEAAFASLLSCIQTDEPWLELSVECKHQFWSVFFFSFVQIIMCRSKGWRDNIGTKKTEYWINNNNKTIHYSQWIVSSLAVFHYFIAILKWIQMHSSVQRMNGEIEKERTRNEKEKLYDAPEKNIILPRKRDDKRKKKCDLCRVTMQLNGGRHETMPARLAEWNGSRNGFVCVFFSQVLFSNVKIGFESSKFQFYANEEKHPNMRQQYYLGAIVSAHRHMSD